MLSNKLFVYGTLKRGGELHSELSSLNAQLLGEAKIRGRLFWIEGESYPGAVPTDSKEYVEGEVYKLQEPTQALKKLDEVEGCDEGLFERKLVDAWMDDRKVKTWAYFYSKPLGDNTPIVTGHFPVKANARMSR